MKYRFLICLLAALTLNVTLYAQLGIGNGRIKGVISDESGSPVAEAEVEVINLKYDMKFRSTSDERGRWGVTGLASGWYKVTAKKEGYLDASIEFQLSLVGQRVHELDVTLRKPEAATAKGMPETKSLAIAALLKDGNELYNLQKYAEALAKFEEFLKEHPETYQVHINIGNCLFGMKEEDKAIIEYNTFLDRLKAEKGTLAGDANAATVLATIGKIHLDREEIEKAKEYFELAVETYPGDKIIPYNVGEIYFNQGQSEPAIDYLLKAVEIDEKWAPPYLKLGYAYLNRGQYKKALESLEKFLELAPDDPQAPSVTNLLPELKKLADKEKGR